MRDLRGQVGVVIVPQRHVVDVFDLCAGHFEDATNRLSRKTGDMFDAFTKPLFRDGGDEFAVAHKAGRSVGVEGIQAEN